ncbi:STAS domain-containing protein [Nocardioides marmotae]|uniref:Anti-sigma factor antagonist n=1 Tax=Nocardioides marmotae TaxID=2663857 RepID=A0A6I3JG59_9ACTN|nr:STAS domain-containing protein [Nocardioides marmotae]MCR6033395.1 anti-sigma factor antagonist [Gordonia jinghuaiqii]MBC9734740.1 STAS domain-containing protein [Nocardioides marmotae]MTB85842.1 anti-sigma factor antagonist [Nocardioides marmotae]MTB97052.1 anti-sigma factor antagonist [Nocardioides marmotae]QKE00713.1 STAS domain-containing protein [Nocardioides marmotae]
MTSDDAFIDEQLCVRVEHRQGFAVVVARGEVDLATVGGFRSVLNDLMVEGHVDVVVDLTDVPFVDSSALGALVAAHRRARGLGGGLSLAGIQPPVARILELTGLDRVLAAYPTADEALRQAGEE